MCTEHFPNMFAQEMWLKAWISCKKVLYIIFSEPTYLLPRRICWHAQEKFDWLIVNIWCIVFLLSGWPTCRGAAPCDGSAWIVQDFPRQDSTLSWEARPAWSSRPASSTCSSPVIERTGLLSEGLQDRISKLQQLHFPGTLCMYLQKFWSDGSITFM